MPRHGHEIHSGNGVIGEVTSGTFSPTLEQGIGMGYVSAEFANPGSAIQISIRGKAVPAEVVRLPFVNREKH